jgi:hypothetical protein
MNNIPPDHLYKAPMTNEKSTDYVSTAHNTVEFAFASLKGIVSRDFIVCFLVSFDRSEVSTHKEWVHLILKFRFRFTTKSRGPIPLSKPCKIVC